jgi:hypothetical protein
MTEQMPAGWVPPSRGRPKTIDATPVFEKAKATPGVWLSFRTFSSAEARSIRNQAVMTEGYKVSLSTAHGVVLYVMYGDEK